MTAQATLVKQAREHPVVVGIGASAGGVAALCSLFSALPDGTGAAFVVILHLDPTTRSELPNILGNLARMPVTQVTSAIPLKPDCVYVIPPDRQLLITDNEIAAVPFEQPRGHRAPVDGFLRSLAAQHGDGIAIILTGGGSDGAMGVRAVKESGGIILVQDPAEAEHSSMPRAAIATDAVDFVLPVKGIAERLAELIRAKQQSAPPEGIADKDDQLKRVLSHLRTRTGHDFSRYKRSTVLRRVMRRQQVSRRDTFDGYLTFLQGNAEEVQALFSDLLISVTSFFRDHQAFEALAQSVVPMLLGREDDRPIRIWAPACATGEEAYSIAMLLMEEASRHDLRPEFQIFGSDLDARALSLARDGRYPATIEADVNEDRLRRFFSRDGEYYRVKRELRDTVLFANHSLLKDPPFSRLDLVTCRNLLIYLDRDMQQQVLGTLHYALNPGGYLFLGSSESAEHPDALFRPLDKDARIYQVAGRQADRLPTLPRMGGVRIEPSITVKAPMALGTRSTEQTHRLALEATAPPSILVDQTNRVLHLSESAGHYLQPSAGPLTHEIAELVRPELRFELRAALQRTFARNEATFSAAIYIRSDGHTRKVYLQVRPVLNGENKCAIVFFLEGEETPADASTPTDTVDGKEVERLRQELEMAETRLRATREDAEATNEELRAANEELQSINEEYRSTAEELETSKEELQSINEELQTVNSELKLKLETVSRANSDLQNLMAAMDFGTLFLDSALKIKRFTPRLADLFSITLNDVGRPITDFTHQLEYDDLTSDAVRVLDDLTPTEREVRSRKGGWYLVRFRPYRTVDDKIDGVVVVFVDVTDRHEMEEALRKSEGLLRQQTHAVELSRAPVFSWELDGNITHWNRGSEELYGFTKKDAIGRPKHELLKTSYQDSSLADVRAELLRSRAWKGECRQVTKNGGLLVVDCRLELAEGAVGQVVLESTRDITQERLWEQRQATLVRELTHRVKNALAVTQGMIHQTWRTSGSSQEFIAKLEARINALAEAHMLLVDADWVDVDLLRLVERQMAPFVKGTPDRFIVDGEQLSLPPEIATGLALVLHELATNATKYGAYSADKGTVKVSWVVSDRAGIPTLQMRWQESGGPIIERPKSTGFGSRLITSVIPNATVQQTFESSGLECFIEIGLAVSQSK